MLSNLQITHAKDYYWIGGSGSWHELSNWSYVSGGHETPSRLPTLEDDVHFDDHSFTSKNQVVYLTEKVAYAQTIDWRTISFPTRLEGLTSQSIVFAGSLYLNPLLDHQFLGMYRAKGSGQTHQLDFANILLESSFTVEAGSNASYVLNSNLTARDLIFQQGDFFSMGFQIQCAHLVITPNRAMILDWADSHVAITGDASEEFLSLEISTTDLSWKSTGALFELMAAYSNCQISGSQPLHLERIVFSNTNGEGILYNGLSANGRVLNINSLHFSGSGSLFGSHHINHLHVAAGGQYSFHSNQKQIIENLISDASWANPIYFYATDSSLPAMLEIRSDHSLSHLVLKDIHQVSTSTIKVTNVVDKGNNRGFEFLNLSASRL